MQQALNAVFHHHLVLAMAGLLLNNQVQHRVKAVVLLECEVGTVVQQQPQQWLTLKYQQLIFYRYVMEPLFQEFQEYNEYHYMLHTLNIHHSRIATQQAHDPYPRILGSDHVLNYS